MNYFAKLKAGCIYVRRKIFLTAQRHRLQNKQICLVSSNCNGAMILHDLGQRFNSPFVDLWIKPQDYIRMLRSLNEYVSAELQFVKEDEISYPVGQLKDIRIYFQHYNSEEEAKEKWNDRVSRMDFDHLFILFTDRDGCTDEDLINFDKLPYEHKAVFVNRPRPELKSAVYISGFENEESVGMCMDFRKDCFYKRYYDEFDYVRWFNS